MRFAIMAFVAVLILNVVKSLYFSHFGAGGPPLTGQQLSDFIGRAVASAIVIAAIIWLITNGTRLPGLLKLGLIVFLGVLLIRDFPPFQVLASHAQGQPWMRAIDDLLSHGTNLAVFLIFVGVIFMVVRKIF